MTRVYRHGEHTGPEVPSHALGTPRDVRAPGNIKHRVREFSRKQPAADRGVGLQNIAVIYADAIAIRDAAANVQTRGAGILFPLLGYLPLFIFLDEFLRGFVDLATDFNAWDAAMLLLCVAVIFWLTPLALLYVKLDLFAPEDTPIIFDRANRKVYRTLLPKRSGLFGPLHVEVAEYDWNRVTAEHRAEITGHGSGVTRRHSLTLVVHDKPRSRGGTGKLLAEFSVGHDWSLGEKTLPMWWEHLRRFMEEGGPGIPEGEVMQVVERPRSLWQSMGVTGPFGPRLRWWWEKHRYLTLFYVLILPFSLPFTWGWAVCNWISHATMRPIVLPSEIEDRLGKPIMVAQ